MPNIYTKGNLDASDFENIQFSDESGQVIYNSATNNTSNFDITLNISQTSSVVQWFISDVYIKKVARLGMDSNYAPYGGTIHDNNYSGNNWYNFTLNYFWSGVSGTHTFKVDQHDSYTNNFRNVKHILLVMKT